MCGVSRESARAEGGIGCSFQGWVAMSAVMNWFAINPMIVVSLVAVVLASAAAACYYPWPSLVAVATIGLTVVLMAGGLLL